MTWRTLGRGLGQCLIGLAFVAGVSEWLQDGDSPRFLTGGEVLWYAFWWALRGGLLVLALFGAWHLGAVWGWWTVDEGRR